MLNRTVLLTAFLIGTVPVLRATASSATPLRPDRRRAATQPPDRRRPAPAARTPAPPAPAAPRREGQPVNIKVEFTITDQRGGAAAIKRTVTVVVADERTGSIRSQSTWFRSAASAECRRVAGAADRRQDPARFQPAVRLAGAARSRRRTARRLPRGTVIKTAMHDSVSLILESGKPMIAAQSADPIGDRQVTVEVKATVLAIGIQASRRPFRRSSTRSGERSGSLHRSDWQQEGLFELVLSRRARRGSLRR